MVTCFNCRENWHFKRECTKPPQQGNKFPFNRNQVANNERNVNDGESLGNDESSGYSGSLDKLGSSSCEDRFEDSAKVDGLIAKVESTDSKEAALEQKIKDSSDNFSKHLSELGSSTFCAAFMARLDCQSSLVSFNKPILSKCVECMVLKGEYLELKRKFDQTKKHHQSLIVDLTRCTKENTALKK
ncbi:putative transcription factor interactor and regulator CCHC(Zn) family [Helianthus anomalus]